MNKFCHWLLLKRVGWGGKIEKPFDKFLWFFVK